MRCQKILREIATRWVAAKPAAEGPLTNLAAVAADERLGSFEATTLAGGACASQLHLRKGAPTYCSEWRKSGSKTNQEGRTGAASDSRRTGT